MICMYKVITYCLQMYLKALEICVSKYVKLILLIFICTRIDIGSLFKEDRNIIRIIKQYCQF